MEKIILLAILISAIVAMAQFPDWLSDRRPALAETRRLGERKIDNRMTQKYGSNPDYQLPVTYLLETKSWSVERHLATTLSEDEARAMMRADDS